MFRPFLIRPSSGWIQLSEEPYKANALTLMGPGAHQGQRHPNCNG